MFGLSSETIRKINEVFSKAPQIEKVILYGSRAKGNYKTGSDIDITLLGKKLNLKTINELEEEIDDIYLPYSFDISIFENIDNDELIEHILRVGKIFYQKETAIPKDWEEKNIVKCIEKIKYTNKILKKDFLETGKFPIISQENEYINGYWDKEEDLFIIEKPVVIFGDHTKIVKYIDFNFVIGADGVKILQTKNIIEPKYFYYYLKSVHLRNLGYARHYKLLKKIKIYFPNSFYEQKRIVSILDKAFASIEKAKQNAEKNLKNAKEIFESYLNGIFENPRDDWEEKKLGEVCENYDSKRIPISKKKRISGPYPYYGASGVVDYVNDYIFDEDLLLVSEDGANLLARKYSIAFSISGKTWVNNHAHVLKFENHISQRFVEYYLNTINLEHYISGMAQPKLNQKMLNSIIISFPKIEIQKRVIGKLDFLFEKKRKLEEIYNKKIAGLDELKQSILEKAFRGEI